MNKDELVIVNVKLPEKQALLPLPKKRHGIVLPTRVPLHIVDGLHYLI